MGKVLACKHLIVLDPSGLLHLINDSVGTKSAGWNLNLFKRSNSTGNPANTSAWIIYVELKLLSCLKIASKHRRPVDSLINGVHWHRGVNRPLGSMPRSLAVDNKSGHSIGTVPEIKNRSNLRVANKCQPR